MILLLKCYCIIQNLSCIVFQQAQDLLHVVDFRTCKIDQSIATSRSQITVTSGHVIKMLNMPFISCFLFIKAVMKLNKSFKK